jgi:hypothetical protein
MSAKSTRATPAREAGRQEPASWNFLTDLSRQQLSVAADASSAMIRGFEAMRKIGQQTAHDASARHKAVAQKLHGTCQLEMQTEMMGCTTHLLDSETALETVSALEAFDMFPGANSWFAPKPVH